MKQIISILISILLLFSSCEEEYIADLNGIENILSIQALITDDASENVVKVMRTHSFYDIPAGEDFVKGAKVELLDADGRSYIGTETSEGIFKINHAAEAGKTYKLKVEAEGELYESEFEQMPSRPTFDSFYVKPETAVTYKYSSTGKVIESKMTGMRAFINVPVTDSLKYHRFAIEKVFEYVLMKDTNIWIYIIDNDTLMKPAIAAMPTYCWRTSSDGGLFNVVGPTDYGNEKIIKNRPLTFGGNQILDYITHDPEFRIEYLAGWIVNVKQFGLNENSYKYYQAMNEQLKANGKLFDAAYTQIQPNIRCISNARKELVGFFELSSLNYFRFYMKSSIGAEESVYYLVDEKIPIPDKGAVEWFKPIFWEY